MTSTASPASNPNHAQTSTAASSSAAPGPPHLVRSSYASATKGKQSSAPAIASSNSQAVGGQAHHAKASSVSPVNGKPATQPAVPTMGAPVIVSSTPIANGAPVPSDHSRRQSSVTISAQSPSGTYIPNGSAPGSSSISNMTFGSLTATGSPAIAHSVPHLPMGSSLGPNMGTPNQPRSPSPIPQPTLSGGRPPTGPQGQGGQIPVNFGSLGGPDGHDQGLRPSAMPQGPANSMPQAQHRRESSQSAHSDLGSAVNRNFTPNNGRNPRTYSQQFPPSNLAHSPNVFRPAPAMPARNPANVPSYVPQVMRQNPNSPYQGNRSPHMAAAPMQPQAHMPGAPPMHPYGGYPPHHMGHQPVKPPFPSQHSSTFDPERQTTPDAQCLNAGVVHQERSHVLSTFSSVFQRPAQPDLSTPAAFEQYLTSMKGHAMFGAPPQPIFYQGDFPYPSAAYVPTMQPGFQPVAPPSPRPHNAPYASPQPYIPAPYNGPHQGMQRSTSGQGPERPSSTGQSQTPNLGTPHPPHTPVATSGSPAPPTNTTFGRKVGSKVVIKNERGEIFDLANIANIAKGSTPPAPVKAGPPPIASSGTGVPSTSTPPAPSVPQRSRTASQSQPAKSDEEKKRDFAEKIRHKVLKDEAEEQKVKEQEQAAAAAKSAQEEADAKVKEAAEKEVAEKEAKAKAEADAKAESEREAKAREAKAKESKEEEERRRKEEEEKWIAELEEMDRLEEERERQYQEKKKAEQEEKKRQGEKAKAQEAEDLRRQEREAEEREASKEKAKEESSQEKAEREKLFSSLKRPTFGPGAHSAAPPVPEPAVTPTPTPPITPALSAASMLPPRSAASTRAKPPSALKLDTNKPVEPAQPTAGMQALRSARILHLQNEAVQYPDGIKSPNPAVNLGAKNRGRVYDKGFLMQFQEVFKEKPSTDWDKILRETVGDTSDSARPQSARPSSSRQPSRAGGVGNFPVNMGSFQAALPGSHQPTRTLPPNTTSAERFAASMRPNPAVPGGFGSFTSGRMPFPMGGAPPMVRNPSQQSIIQHGLPSPRQTSRSKQGSRRSNQHNPTQLDKAMPLTASQGIKPLEASGSGWKPTSLAPGGSSQPLPGGYMTPDVVQRKVKAALNKMTPEKFDRIAQSILDIAAQSKDEQDGRTLRQVIQLTFEKACDEAHWAAMYAKFCKRMMETMNSEIKDDQVVDKNGNPVVGGALFRKYLLNRCQEEFERGWEVNLPKNPEGAPGEAAMLSDEYYVAAAAKRRGLGLIQFIGELYKLNMLNVRIMHECLRKLLDFEGHPDESAIESLVKLLKTVGAVMDSTDSGRPIMAAYFQRIETIMSLEGLQSRMYFMLLDTVELRAKGWESKNANKGPMTISEIHQSAAAQQQAEAERQRQNRNRPMPGRGDSRTFSSSGMPPQDYARNTVGMDDLKKLTRGAKPSGSGGLGPSLLGSRSNSGRKGLGPLSRAEDSGASSRTGTPPVKESTAHVNAYSALASLDNSGEGADDVASPPSNASSPPVTKSVPAVAKASQDGK